MSAATSGQVAAARAYAKAGNFKLAERQLKEALAADPNDREACEAWCGLLTHQNKFAELETFAAAWIGRGASHPFAYAKLFDAYAVRRDRERASAILQRYRELFPARVREHAQMRAMLEAHCGADATRYDEIIAWCRAYNDKKNLLRYQSQDACARSRFAEALRLGEEARQAGCDEADFARYLAEVAFRAFRLSTSRRYAALALLGEPRNPVASELRVWCRLVWFPPFLAAHALLFAFGYLRGKRRTRPRAKTGPAVVGLVLGIAANISAGRAPAHAIEATFALMALYYIYYPFIGTATMLLRGRGSGVIRLADY